MCSARRFKPGRRRAGFTLVEMAVVVVIAGIILVALLPALRNMQSGMQLAATQTNLQALLRATAAYALANGCLPCPMPASAAIGGLGKVRGDTTPNAAACGACATADGMVPFVALGLDPSAARDGWGRWITMHIDPVLAAPCTNAEITNRTAGCVAPLDRICRSGLASAGRVAVTVNLGSTFSNAMAAVIFVSHGANGYGAYRSQRAPTTPRMAVPTTCAPGLLQYEACNAKQPGSYNETGFYVAERSAGFDDVVTYADRNALVSLFGNANCPTAW